MVELNLKRINSKKYILTIIKDNKILHKYVRSLDICCDILLSFFDILGSKQLKMTGEWK